MGLWDLPKKEIDSICFFQNCGILPKSRYCSDSHPMKLDIHQKPKPVWKCTDTRCPMAFQLKEGNWFSDTRMEFSFTSIIQFLYCWSRELTTEEFCKYQLLMKPETALYWHIKVHEICAAEVLREKDLCSESYDSINWNSVSPFHKSPINSPQEQMLYIDEYHWRKMQAEKEVDCFEGILEAIGFLYPPEIKKINGPQINEKGEVEIKCEPDIDME